MKDIFQGILKGSVIITASRLLLKVFSGISYFLILRQLSVGEYGLVTLALSLSGPALAICGFGLDDLLIAKGARARGEGKLEKFLPTLRGFALMKVVTLCGLLLTAVFARSLLSIKYQSLLQQFLLPLLVWIALSVIRVMIDDLLQIFENFSAGARANVIETLSRLVCIFVLFLTHHITTPLVILSYVVGKFCGVAYTCSVLRWLGTRSVALSVKAFASFSVGQGKWEIARGFFGNLLGGVDQWMLGLMLGAQAVGMYSFALTMNSFLSSALPLRQVLFPILSRLSAEPRTSSFVSRRITKYSFWFNSLVVVVGIIGAPIAVHFLAPNFTPAIVVFDVLAFGQLLNALTTGHSSLFYALSEQRFLLLVSFVGTISAFTLLPGLIILLGVVGAVLENHLSTGIVILLRERHLRKKHGIITFAFRDLITFDEFDRNVVSRLVTAVRTRSASV